MKKIDKNRITISMSNDDRDNLNKAISYFSKPENGGIHSYSGAATQIINVFVELFIESSPRQIDFKTRLDQLKEIIPKDSQKILAELAIVKKQNDIISYQNLALNQKLGKNPNWKPEYLQSVYSSRDMEQVELIETIDQLISEDRARGQVVKNSHLKNG